METERGLLMAVVAHPHDWTAVAGGYACQGCSAYVPDAKMTPTAAAGATGDSDAGVDAVWYGVIGGV
jgi:hypothetical protein